MAAFAATINKPFFNSDLPNSTLRTLYRTNVRSILMYGLMLTGDVTEIEKLDRQMLNTYFKPITKHKKATSEKLIDRFCLRIRLPSLQLDLEPSIKGWISRLRSSTAQGLNKKTRQHAKDTIRAITKMSPNTALRLHYTMRGSPKKSILLA